MSILLLLLILFQSLFGSGFDEEDPSYYFNVHVISGHLELDFCDVELRSPIPFSLTRHYTSSGALERKYKSEADMHLRGASKSGLMLAGGWTVLPRLNLLIGKDKTAYFQTKWGLLKYSRDKAAFYEQDEKHYYYLRPKKERERTADMLLFEDPYYTYLKIRKKAKKGRPQEAIHYLGDGTERHYKRTSGAKESFWRLTHEILPSKHRIEYDYFGGIETIRLKNPAGSKTLGQLYVHKEYGDRPSTTIASSDGQSVTYECSRVHEKRRYLSSCASTARDPEGDYHVQLRKREEADATGWNKCLSTPSSALRQTTTPCTIDHYAYVAGRKGIGARMCGMHRAGKEHFRVEYHRPPTLEKERKWADHPDKRHTQGDKVKSLHIYDPVTKQFVPFATFAYTKESTTVTDYEGNTTTYRHDGERLDSIAYHFPDGALHSQVEFTWSGDDLTGKTLKDPENQPLFSKQFIRATSGTHLRGKIISEIWTDHTSELPPIVRRFDYTANGQLKYELNENGLTYRLTYKQTTNLLTSKRTIANKQQVLREFFEYDDDNLLIARYIDDGARHSCHDPEGATHRKIERYERDPKTGLCTCEKTYYYDPDKQREILSHTRALTYNNKNQVIQIDEQFAGSDQVRTTTMRYNDRGRLIEKTSPLGRKSHYSYDPSGNLIRCKEPGAPEKTYTYDHNGRPILCQESDQTTQSRYDLKGRLLSQTDPLGNPLHQTFDTFGNCIETTLAPYLDSEDRPKTPRARMTHDIQNNITSHQDPLGGTTHTSYNILRKPTHIQHPDGSETHHSYNRDGTIAITIQPDNSEIHYSYDHFQRMIQKTTLSPDKEPLSQETWNYSTFHLLSHTDPLGVTTHYSYNAKGEKIAEIAQDRETHYSYDPAGNLERIQKGDWTKVQNYNLENEIIALWEEGPDSIENQMHYTYDSEGRKTQALRITDAGEAHDQFTYDTQNRLTSHTDPLGHTTHFHYSESINSLGQRALVKTTIDPLGNQHIETHDAQNRPIRIEKQTPEGATYALEENHYDPLGNREKRTITLYQESNPTSTHITQWEYNSRSLPTKEIEQNEKTTTYSYDPMGRLIEKTLPSKTRISYRYDSLGRTLEIQAPDLHYSYQYDKSDRPIKATDNLRNLTWTREYNPFGELIKETHPDGIALHWQRDNQGRVTQLTLPDGSSIRYNYRGKHLTRVSRHSSKPYSHHYTQFDKWGHVAEEQLIHSLGTILSERDLLERPCQIQTPYDTTQITYNPLSLVATIDSTLSRSATYSYDPLNQLTHDGETSYQFDSLGNPLTAEVNPLNQITQQDNYRLQYDPDGNPREKTTPQETTSYSYDPLGRLIRISPDITYTYDPFHRLYAKESHTQKQSWFTRDVTHTTRRYLYDQENEIGSFDPTTRELLDLKVLGLGIKGDIGAAIAIELKNKTYAPLHDPQGNIIALIDTSGNLCFHSPLDPFGKATTSKNALHPWHYQSKRTEGKLILFGKRFYDPSLGRFLTPDPAGSLESANLYLYTLNSPPNRLDLFGLYSEEFSTRSSLDSAIQAQDGFIRSQAEFRGIKTDWLIYSNQLHKLQFTPEELQSGHFDILLHLDELLPKEGLAVGLVTAQNGIKNDMEDFQTFAKSLHSSLPEDSFLIVMHNPTKGFWNDVESTKKEKSREGTPESAMTQQTFSALLETVGKVNQNLLWAHVCHSRAGATGCAAIDGLTENERKELRRKLIWLGVAPEEPILKQHCLDSNNVYSENDWVTGSVGQQYKGEQRRLPKSEKPYNIEFVKAIGHPRNGIAEHGFNEPTYQTCLKKFIDDVEKSYGFYKNSR